MREKILGIAMVAAIALVAGWNLNQSKSDAVLSDIALSNVEALASGESGKDCNSCYTNLNTVCEFWGWGGCLGTPKYILA